MHAPAFPGPAYLFEEVFIFVKMRTHAASTRLADTLRVVHMKCEDVQKLAEEVSGCGRFLHRV